MPDQNSSSSSSSSSDDGKRKESPSRRRSSSRESEKRRDSKRNYSSSDEDRKSKRRKELTVLSRNAKYGHRGFVGASFSRYKKGSRSRSVSKERYRSRDYRQRRDISRYSRDDSYRRRTSDRRDRRRERHRSRDRNLRDRSRDRRRSKDRKERSRDRSRDRRRSKDRRERSRDRSEDKKEKDRDRSKDRKERNRDRSKDRRERSRSRSQSRSRNCSGDRSKSMERGSRKRRDSSRERNKDKREKGRERSHSGDRNKEREKKSRERSHDRSQSKEKSKERGHDRSQSKERCKEKPNLEGDQKISSYGGQSKVEKEGKVSCSSDDKRGESVSNIHDETPYADEEKSNLKEGNKADAKNSSEEDKEEYQDDKCEVLLKEENHPKLKGDNLNEDKEMFRQEKKIEKSDCKPSEIKLDVKEGSEKKDYEVKGKGTHIHSSKAEDKNLPEDDKRTYREYDEKSSNSKEFGTNEEIQERDCDDSSEMGHSDSLDASESTAHTSMKSKDKLRKMPSPNYSSKHHVRASSTESSLSHSSHPTEKCEAIPDDNKVERESSNLDELEKLKEKITKELADDGRTRKHKSKKKKKSEKNEDSQREENINESSTTTMDSSSKKRKKMESSDSPRKDEKDADSSLNSKASSSRHHKRRRSKSNSRLSISPEKGKDERKSKGKHRKIENERDTYEERKRETDYDKKRRKEYEENDKEISKHKSSLQQDDKSKPDEKMFEEEKFASSLQIKKPVVDPLSKRTGGAYIPPGRLKLMQDQIKDKASESFQRLSWEALKKSINGIVNKVNVSNIGIIIRELFQENIVRGRGLLCRSLMQAQSFSQTFTHVYSALVCAINTKFPQIGELLLNRLIIQLRRGIKRNDKNICMASCKFLAHLVNQQVAHEVIALELLTLLLEKAKDLSDDSENGVKAREASIELSIVFLKECGMKLGELTPKGLTIITESLRNILHEGKLDSRYRYMVESLLAIQKDKFKGFESVNEDLDLVDDEDKITHIVELDGQLDGQDILNIFKVETDYLDNEAKYKELKSGILGASDDDGSESDSDSESGSDDDESGSSSDEEGNKRTTNDAGDVIVDRTETNLVAFRRTVYLTIQSSLDVDECAHKLLKGEIKPGWEEELCNMVIDCCAQQRTYMKFYGLLAERFCRLNKTYREFFETLFLSAYSTCHRLEIEKLRNVSKLFSHLLHTDAISWEVMANVQLNEDQTTSSSRVFLKILFEELANFMGLNKLNERLREPTLSHAFEGLLPRDNPNKTRFAINFFTMIGLGGLTDGLREFLRTQPKPTAVVAPVQKGTSLDSSSTDSEDSSDGSSSSSNSSDDDDSDSSDSSSESSSDDDSGSDASDDSSGSDKGSKAKKRKLSSKNKKGKSKSTSSSSKKRPRPSDEVRPTVRSYISSDRPDKKTSSSSSSSRKRSSRL